MLPISGLMLPVAIIMLLAGAGLLLAPRLMAESGRDSTKRRLKVEAPHEVEAKTKVAERRAEESEIREKAKKRAQDFYLKTDPENVQRIRQKLIQAGYFDPGAVGNFFLIRFVTFAVGGLGMTVVAFMKNGFTFSVLMTGFLAGAVWYFIPGLLLSQKVKARRQDYRNAFPDFMDLMIVCADAGMSMEASMDRVAREMEVTCPPLAQNLQLLNIELRAGRSIEDALKSLSDRLGLDEVRSFATLLQQSKELGTSLSGALRVFSDEMRHKRMSAAEEKAHALPAKMSVPVTVCILPAVMMVAIIPIIVKLTLGQF